MERQYEVCTRVFRERLRSRLVHTKFLVQSKVSPELFCFVVFLVHLTYSCFRMFLDCWYLGFLDTPSGKL